MDKSDRMRNQDRPTVFGYELDRVNLRPIHQTIDTNKTGDYGADPIGDGTYRMIPSGAIVSYAERCRRLAKP
jgi:hypothetical protein